MISRVTEPLVLLHGFAGTRRSWQPVAERLGTAWSLPLGAARLGAPRARMPLRATPLLAVAVAALAVFLPVFGVSLAVVLLADRFLLRRLPALTRWFDVKG